MQTITLTLNLSMDIMQLLPADLTCIVPWLAAKHNVGKGLSNCTSLKITPHPPAYNDYLMGLGLHQVGLLPRLTLYRLVYLANVNNGSHGAVVRYFTTTYTLCVIKSMTCQSTQCKTISVLTNNGMHKYMCFVKLLHK